MRTEERFINENIIFQKIFFSESVDNAFVVTRSHLQNPFASHSTLKERKQLAKRSSIICHIMTFFGSFEEFIACLKNMMSGFFDFKPDLVLRGRESSRPNKTEHL